MEDVIQRIDEDGVILELGVVGEVRFRPEHGDVAALQGLL